METIDYFLKGEGIVLGYENPISVEPFSFQFPQGKLVTLIGRNGSGKSTFLNALIGAPTLKAGNIVGAQGLKVAATDFAFVPQEHCYPPHFKVVDILKMAFLKGAGLWGKLPTDSDAELTSILDLFLLREMSGRKMASLSSGERQRVFLGRALLQKPKILLLDEPTNHLDPPGIKAFWECLLAVKSRSKLDIVLSTHDLSFVERHSEYIIGFKKGSPVPHGTDPF